MGTVGRLGRPCERIDVSRSLAHQMRAKPDARKVRRAEIIREPDDQWLAMHEPHMDANRRPVKMNTHPSLFGPICQRLEGRYQGLAIR